MCDMVLYHNNAMMLLAKTTCSIFLSC